MVRILRSQQQGLSSPYIQEADDGDSAVQMVQQEMDSDGHFDFILMDNIMVGLLLLLHGSRLFVIIMFLSIIVEIKWSGCCGDHSEEVDVQRRHSRY